MRTFEQTHPWLSFEFRADRLSHIAWMLIGEARSKCEHINDAPLHPDVASRLHSLYLSKGAAATTAIEGNTLTEDEVRQRIEGTLSLPPSREYLGIEVDNIVAACNDIQEDVAAGREFKLEPERILAFNRQVLADLELKEGVIPGEYRTHSVLVGGIYRGAPAEDCEYLQGRMCEWLNGPAFFSDDADMAFALQLFRAILAHLYIAWIHPFGDGNGRTARLVELQILLHSGYVSTPAAHLLSNHFNLTRSRYCEQLDSAGKQTDGVASFIEYATRGFVDGLREQLKEIREQQLVVTWRDVVNGHFHSLHGKTAERQRRLLLDLRLPTPRREITHVSPHVAELYAGLSEKTVSRDLAALEAAGLIVRKDDLLAPNFGLVLEFLPLRAPRGPTRGEAV
jgi:Fic family protein